jgi:hypothetical protein
MKTQEDVLKEFERKYSEILQPQMKKEAEKKEGEQTKSGGGVLVG